MQDLNTTTEKINLTVTVYIVMQAIAPAIWGPIADRSGRRPMYLLAILVYTASCTGLALAPTYSVLLVMRLLQSFGGSPTVAIGTCLNNQQWIMFLTMWFIFRFWNHW